MEISRVLLRTAGCVLAVLLSLSGLPGNLPGIDAAQAGDPVTLVVDQVEDLPPESADCSADGTGMCSLRGALQAAQTEALAGFRISFSDDLQDAVIFLVGGLGSLQLNATCELGRTCLLDGETHGVTIDGSGLPPGSPILRVSGQFSTIRNLSFVNSRGDGIQIGTGNSSGSGIIIERSTFLGNAGAGVSVQQGGSMSTIQDSLFGAQDASAAGCIPGQANQVGIQIRPGADDVKIASNTVGCSEGDGIALLNADSARPSRTTIRGNYIGVSADGAALPNHASGIYDQGLLTYTRENVISGNGEDGIRVAGAAQAFIIANRIGTDPTGDSAVPNAGNGIAIQAGSTLIHVGLTLPKDRNIISGNGAFGVAVLGLSSEVSIDGNFVGVNWLGEAAVPNRLAGILVEKAQGVQIGSNNIEIFQLISGNGQQGIHLIGAVDTQIERNNWIGTGEAGSLPLGNGLEGVLLEAGTAGTTLRNAAIAYNGRAGVGIAAGSGAGNNLRPERVYQNGGLPIDVGNDGPTPNGTAPAYTPYPLLLGSDGVSLWGSACSGCQVQIYQAVGDPGRPGGGGVWLADTAADATGAWSIIDLPAGVGAGRFTLLAVEPGSGRGTSEMSPQPQFSFFLPLIQQP